MDTDSVDELGIDENDQALADAIATGWVTLIDGVMSPMSVKISEHFGTNRFDMDAWWVRTPQDWVCPACGRTKEQIARRNTKGEIMCRLASHHDHMEDVLKRRFQEISVSRQKVVASQDAEAFAKRSATMVAAYDRTLICVDCNNADVKAKEAAQTDEHFSFSPQELRRIVRAEPNTPHERIDEDVAKAIWLEARSTFELRMRIADRIADIAASNQHWFQPGDRRSNPKAITKHSEWFFSYKKTTTRILDVLKGPKDGPPERSASAWREVLHSPPSRSPTNNEMEHAGIVGSPRYWKLISEEWRCPGCNRSKRQIVRKNRRKEWVFPAGYRIFFNDALPYNRHNVLNCGDCAKIGEDLGKEAAQSLGMSFDGYASNVTIYEVRQCLMPTPHSRHNVDNHQVEIVLDAVVSRILASIEPSETEYEWDGEE